MARATSERTRPTLDRRPDAFEVAVRVERDVYARENGGNLRKPFANAAQPMPETAPNTAVNADADMSFVLKRGTLPLPLPVTTLKRTMHSAWNYSGNGGTTAC